MEAADSSFRFAVEAAVESEGERIKKRKPRDKRPASISVIGLVRRIDRGRAMSDS